MSGLNTRHEEQYDVFLCHSTVDKPVVRDLAKRLEREPYDGRTLRVFLDEWDVAPGENIPLRLNQGLATARFLAVFISPEMLASDWCAAEVSAVFAQDPANRGGRILPVRLRDRDASGNHGLEVPPLLRALSWIDLRGKSWDERQYRQLVARLVGACPRPSGRTGDSRAVYRPLPDTGARGSLPEDAAERVLLNLLPVLELPEHLWLVPVGSTHESGRHNDARVPFVVDERSIITFSAADAKLLNPNAQPQSQLLRDWVVNRDRNKVTELLNWTLVHQLHPRFFATRRRGARRFVARAPRGKDGMCRGLRAKLGGGRGRKIVGKPVEEGGFWVHMAAELKFTWLQSQVFLELAPTYAFTTDGIELVTDRRRTHQLSMQWAGKERNYAVLLSFLWWCGFVLDGLHGNRAGLKLGGIPAIAGVGHRVAGDQKEVKSLSRLIRAAEFGEHVSVEYMEY